jgi:hypothetical protein
VATLLEGFTTKEQRSVVFFFCGHNYSMQGIFIKMFAVYEAECLSRKAVHNWVQKRGRCFSHDEEVETKVRKWLRQQPKDLCGSGFKAVVNLWDKCINVSRNNFFKSVYHMFYVNISVNIRL